MVVGVPYFKKTPLVLSMTMKLYVYVVLLMLTIIDRIIYWTELIYAYIYIYIHIHDIIYTYVLWLYCMDHTQQDDKKRKMMPYILIIAIWSNQKSKAHWTSFEE